MNGQQGDVDSGYGDWERLKAWADSRHLEVRYWPGTQREPENVAMVRRPGGGGGAIIKRESYDSVEQAITYLVNTLELLGVEIPR